LRRFFNMTKRNYSAALRALFFACLLIAFTLTGIASGATKNDSPVKEWKGGDSSGSKIVLAAQAKNRSIPLAGSSANKVLPPPCTVTGVKGKMVTLKDFYGRIDTVEVLDATGIQVGEQAVVKNGRLKLGPRPE